MGSMLASPRIFFAMADDKLFFRPIAAVHPTWNTPYVAILLACGPGRGDGDDADLRAAHRHVRAGDVAVLRAERRRPLPPARAYNRTCTGPTRSWAIPFVPAVFIAAAIYLVINALITDPKWTSITFAVVLAGLPVYYLWFSGGARNGSRPVQRGRATEPTRTSATGNRRRRRWCRSPSSPSAKTETPPRCRLPGPSRSGRTAARAR